MVPCERRGKIILLENTDQDGGEKKKEAEFRTSEILNTRGATIKNVLKLNLRTDPVEELLRNLKLCASVFIVDESCAVCVYLRSS